MTIQFKKAAFIVATLISTVVFSNLASAEAMVSTGGYNREIQTMGMMKMIDTNGDHMVSQEEFTRYYGDLFDMLDSNKDGVLDAKEWVGVKGKQDLSLTTGGYATHLRTMKMMGVMDTNGDHQITKDEFVNYHQNIFSAMDKKGDGMITAQEWAGKLL